MDYQEWNDLIAKHFFDESKAGREVLLYVNEQLINELGASKGVGLQDFIEAVKKGPSWATHSGFCQRALQALKNWRMRDLEYPTYVAYLALFVLAAGTEGDFDPKAYYPRFWKLLNELDSGTPPSFDRMAELWDDLEKWSREDKHEEFGKFVTRRRGGWCNVGLPLSQTVISEDERKSLPVLFERADLDPSAPPSPQVMLKFMHYYGKEIFERRTLRVLNMEQVENVILKDKLVEITLEELEEWDGTIQAEMEVEDKADHKGEEKGEQKTKSGLRICLHYDSMSNQVKAIIRLKANKDYPEDGLIFSCKHIPGTPLYCEELYQGWSKKIKAGESGKLVDAATLDWTNGVQFEDKENKWRAVLKGYEARLFISGNQESLPGWIETNRLERGISFLLSTYGEYTKRVCEWGKEFCGSFNELKVTGLPDGWSLFKGQNATSSCDDIDVLTIPSSVRLLLRGGVKIRGGNTYLYDAPPLIVLENASGEEKVTINDRLMIRVSNESHIWKLPEDVPVNEILRIEAKAGDEELNKVLLCLEEPGLVDSFENTPWRNMEGSLISNSSVYPRMRGAIIEVSGNGNVHYPLVSNHGCTKKIIFVGNLPGQIVEWPYEAFPSAWEPLWAIEKKSRKKWEVFYCRKSIDSIPTPQSVVRNRNRRDVKKWKEAIWFRRKIIQKPAIVSVRKKWLEFVEATGNV